MNGTAMELSKAAAEAAADTLAPAQMLGVLTFNNESNWDVPLGRVRDSRPTLHDAIARSPRAARRRSIRRSARPTSRSPASARAPSTSSCSRTASPSRRTSRALVRQMSDAHITVSTVALGPEADVTLLRNLATWGGGRNYVVQDAQQIPEIFVKEARSAATPESDEAGSHDAHGPIRLLMLLDAADRFPGAAGSQHGDAQTPGHRMARDAAQRSAADRSGRPASDERRCSPRISTADGRATGCAGSGLGGFLGGLVRSLAPRPAAVVVADRDGRRAAGLARQLTVSLDARDRDGRRGESADAQSGGALGHGRTRDDRTGRGRARPIRSASRRGHERAADLLRWSSPAGDAGASRILAVDQAAEYRFGTPDDSAAVVHLPRSPAARCGRPTTMSGARRATSAGRAISSRRGCWRWRSCCGPWTSCCAGFSADSPRRRPGT